MSDRQAQWFLIAIVVLGAVLRFYRLGFQSLWIDEVLTIHAAGFGERLSFPEVFWNIQGPLHSTLVHAIGSLTTSEFALRLPSAILGTATIPVVYLLGRDLADRRTGLVAALLVAVSPFAVWYSQELRNYSFLMFFSALSTLLVFRLVERKGTGWILYVAAVVLGVLSNFAAGFLAIAHHLFAAGRVLRDRRLAARWALAWVAVLVLLIPAIMGLVRWTSIDNVGERVVLPAAAEEQELLRGETTFTPAAVPYAFFALSYGSTFGPSLRELHVASPARAFRKHAPLVAPAALAYAVACLLGLWRFRRSRRELVLILSVLVVPVAGASLLALANIKPFNPRYVSVSLPVLLVVAGAGIGSLRRVPAALLCGLIAVFCMVSLGNYYFRGDYRREDVRGVVRYLEARERPGDMILAPVVGDVLEFYFGGAADRFIIYPGQAGSDAEVASRIEAAVPGHDRLWFVDSRLWHADPERRVPAYLEGRYRRAAEETFDGVRVVLYELAPAVPAE